MGAFAAVGDLGRAEDPTDLHARARIGLEGLVRKVLVDFEAGAVAAFVFVDRHMGENVLGMPTAESQPRKSLLFDRVPARGSKGLRIADRRRPAAFGTQEGRR